MVSSSCFKEEEELEGERDDEEQEDQTQEQEEQTQEQEEQTQEHVTPRRKDRMSRSGAVAKVLSSLSLH